MKTIAIITSFKERSAVNYTIRNNIESVFDEYVKVKQYYFDCLYEGQEINGDLVLVMMEEYISYASKYVNDTSKILVIERAIKADEVYKIMQIPKGRSVLVVNDSNATTLQTTIMLRQIGVNHLNLISYNKNEEVSKNIKIAITPGESVHVPYFIENIIDVGNRCLDVNTMLKIIDKLSIDSTLISSKLINYFNGIVDKNTGLKGKYIDLYIKNEQFKKVMQKSNEGILLTDNDYKILYCNEKLRTMMGIETEINGLLLSDILQIEIYEFLIKDYLNQELLNLNNEYTLVTKSELMYFNEKGGYCYNFHTITYIRQLQQNAGEQIRKVNQIARYTFDDILFYSKSMSRCIELAKKSAMSSATILITGETGTGKELVAQSIHNYSDRKNYSFVAINCAALPESLLESELFGYESGSFTGASKSGKIGFFEQANGGTIFLDEIGDMPIKLQTRLLRVIQEKQIVRIGGDKAIDINIRIILATNKNLKLLMAEDKFRRDLYYRISAIPIKIPPLRERKEDILELFKYYTGEVYNTLSKEDKERLLNYSWEGNIRELQNIAEYYLIMGEFNNETINNTTYVINNEESYNLDMLNKLIGEFDLGTLLEIVEDFTNDNIGIGRLKLMETLFEYDVKIGESRLRKILRFLSLDGYIDIYKGRQGCKITKKGVALRNWIKNRDK